MISLYDNKGSSPAPSPSPAPSAIRLYSDSGSPAPAAQPAPSTASPIRLYNDASAPKTSPAAPAPQDSPSPSPSPIQGKYGPSVATDPASGKALLWYENPQAKSSQLLSDRTYPGFDPTVPQKIDPLTLHNPRMKQDISTGIRKALGATAFEELDHIMPLELGGSNNQSNLRREQAKDPSKPYSPGSNPTPTDALENQLAAKAHNGDKTGYPLVQAWRDMAKAKGITLPEDQKPTSSQDPASSLAKDVLTKFPFSAPNNSNSTSALAPTLPSPDYSIENAITNFAPFQQLARMNGGESILDAFMEVYDNRAYEALNSDDINAVINRRTDLIQKGSDPHKATIQAVTEAKQGKLQAQMIASVNPEADLADTAKAIEAIAKSSDPAAIASLLKKVPGVAPEDIPVLSKALKGISNPDDVKSVISGVTGKTPNSNVFYHGTTSEGAKSIEQSGFKLGSEGMNRGNGISLSTDKEVAATFSEKDGTPGKVFEVHLKPDAKLVSSAEFIATKNAIAEQSGFDTATQKAQEFYRSKGYDGIDFRDTQHSPGSIPDAMKNEVRLWNPDIVDHVQHSAKTHTGMDLVDEGITNAQINAAKLQATLEARTAMEDKAALAPPPERETFLSKLKNVLNPLKGQDPEVKAAFEDYSKKLAEARPLANAEASKLRNIAPQEGLDTILRYERGSRTPYTEQIKDQFEGLFKEANDRGLDTEHRGNYLPHAYAETKDQIGEVMKTYLAKKGVPEEMVNDFMNGKQPIPDSVVKRLGLNPFFTKTRTFPTYDAAIEAGLHPKYTHPAQLAGLYRENMEHAIASREFVQNLVDKGKLFPADLAPKGYQPVNLEFSQQGYYAKPRLAQMINGLFNDSNSKSFFQHVIGVTGKVSRVVQKMELTTGFPGTNINVHSIGQVIKEITAGDFSKVKAFVRANSNDASVKFFEANRDVLQRMAAQNLDLGTTVADYPNLYKNLMKPDVSAAYSRGGVKSVAEFLQKETGTTLEHIFTKKNFSSFMPQLYVSTFKDAAERFKAQGMAQDKADKLATDVVRAFHGLIGNVGRAPMTEDSLSTAFFAPKFRESIINTLWNSGRSITTEFSNPAFYKNRRLVGGMALTFGLYTGANKFMNGHFMWQNPSTHQFDLQIPTGNSNYAYVPFMPTFLAVPRNIFGGVLSVGQSDLKGATQEFSSVLSAPLQLFGQLYANKDFFGRPIYADTDPGAVKAQKIASYLGLNVIPPWIKETVNYIAKKGQVPLYQAITTGMELPIKYGNDLKNSQSALAQATQNLAMQHAAALDSFRPTYDKVQSLIQAGKQDDAQKLVESLSDSDYQLYKDLKTVDTKKNTSKGEAQFLPTYQQIKTLIQNGKTADAQKVLDGLSSQEYKFYQALKKRGI